MEKWIGEYYGKMKVNGITQRELAKRMGYTVNYISMIFKGKRSPKGIEDKVCRTVDEMIKEKEAE